MEWVTHWDQGAWGTALGVVGALGAVTAHARVWLVKRDVSRRLHGDRFADALAALEVAGQVLLSAATSRAAFDVAVRSWQRCVTEVRALATLAAHENKPLDDLLKNIATMASTSREAITNGATIAAATRLLRDAVEEAIDLAGTTRITLRSGK